MARVSLLFFVSAMCFILHPNTCRLLTPADNFVPQMEPTVVHKWVTVNYHMPQNFSYHRFQMTYPYDYRNSVLGGIRVYKDEIYVTVPRISSGVPSTLNRLVEKDGETKLDAFPSWEWQTIGDCDALQAVNSIEVDPEKGWMWIIDTGRVNTFWGGLRNLCQPKLIIYDLNKDEVVTRYEFPPDVASIKNAYFSNIAIDPEAGYAFIPDTVVGKMIFFSLNDNFSISIDHPLFKFEEGNQSIIVDGRKIVLANVSANIYSVTMSPRRDYILYSHLGGHGLYRISMEFFKKLLKDPSHVSEVGNYIKRVGYKVSQSMSLLMGQDSLYYGALGKKAVFKWQVDDQLSYQNIPQDVLAHSPQSLFVADDRMYWINSISLDSDGIMWITSSNLVRYFLDVMDYHNTYNYFIWKVQVGDKSYLKKKTSPLKSTTTTTTTTTTTPTTSLTAVVVDDGGNNSASLNGMSAVLVAVRLMQTVVILATS